MLYIIALLEDITKSRRIKRSFYKNPVYRVMRSYSNKRIPSRKRITLWQFDYVLIIREFDSWLPRLV